MSSRSSVIAPATPDKRELISTGDIVWVDFKEHFIDYGYPRKRVIVIGMRTQAIEPDERGEAAVASGGNRGMGRFWVPLVWAAVPTLLVTVFTCFLWWYYEPPEFVVGVLFFAVVIPAAVIC